MDTFALLLLLVPVLSALAFLFGRNAQRGVRTGVVWVKGTRYLRDEAPILFWFSVGLSITFAAVGVSGTVIAIWTLVGLI